MDKTKTAKIKQLLKENDGLTIDIKTLKPKKFKSGFYIGLTDNQNKNIDFLLNKVSFQLKGFSSEKGLYLGLWTDNKTDLSYFDISTHSFNLDIALIIAKHFKQKAIYDIQNNKSIYL